MQQVLGEDNSGKPTSPDACIQIDEIKKRVFSAAVAAVVAFKEKKFSLDRNLKFNHSMNIIRIIIKCGLKSNGYRFWIRCSHKQIVITQSEIKYCKIPYRARLRFALLYSCFYIYVG